MPSQLTPDEVARIAELARLEISPEEGARFARQLTAILDYAARVQQVDTTLTAPENAATAPEGAPAPPASWRDDEAGHCLAREDALAAAPDAARELGLFRVPKVL